MPWKSPHLCPRCKNNTTKQRYCKACRAAEYRKSIDRTAFYKSDEWEFLRAKKLQESPFCECPDPTCNEIATEVDHIIPRSKGGPDIIENLQSLTKSCHSKKTAMENGLNG